MNQTYKEIHLQPETFISIYENLDKVYEELSLVFTNGQSTYQKVIFTGCGTSFYLAQTAAQLFTKYTEIQSIAVPCSELYYFSERYLSSKSVLVVPITRKSHTTEVRMAIDKVRSYTNVKTLAITCDPLSKEYNDFMIVALNTSESSVVMTRSYTSMVFLTYILALFVGGKVEELNSLEEIGDISKKIIREMDDLAKRIIIENPNLNLFVSLGQGELYGVANECTNKMKEMGIVNSEAYHSLEYRHGPMSLANSNTLIICLTHSKSRTLDKNLLQQLEGFGCVTVALGQQVSDLGAEYSLETPRNLNDSQLSIFLGIMGQLLGLYLADKKGLNPDKPKNLTQAIVL